MENSKLVILGSSNLVPSVKELAKQSMVTPPERYIRPSQDPPIKSNPTWFPTVPVVDLQKLLSKDSTDIELDRLHSACKDWGFFQLVNHGVPTTLLEKMRKGVEEFFELPVEEKMRFWQQEGELEGFGQHFVLSDEHKIDWADIFFLTTLPVNARKPHLFPKLPSNFRDTLNEYILELKDLATTILKLIEKTLQTEVNEVSKLFEDGFQAMRLNYYPPCSQPEKVIGLTPHSDSVGLTILLQLNDVDGLQIKKEGVWNSIKPLSNTFIVNVGDILEIITNGMYQSVEHRAIINSTNERLSVATFYSPRFDVEIGPADSLIAPGTPALYRRILVEDYFKSFFARELAGRSYINAMKMENINNSCDEVPEKTYETCS